MKNVFATLVMCAVAVLAQLDHHHAGFNLRARVAHQKRMTVLRRKPIGWGDSVTAPATVAKGSDSSSCTCWHTVADGEVCLGLIDKSSAGFTLDKFFQLNPSLNNDCSNLITGVSYCVDDGANTFPNGNNNATVASTSNNKAKASENVDLAAAKVASTTVKASAPTTATASASASASTEDEEEDDEDDDGDCDSEEEDDEDDVSTTATATVKVNNNLKAAVNTNTWAAASSAQQDTWVAPTTSTSQWVAPTTTTSVWVAPTTSAVAQVEASVGVSTGGQSFTGEATFYYQGGQPGGTPVAGACGTVSQDTDYVAALYTNIYASGANCGRKIKLTNTQSGASVTVTAMDMCPSCTDNGHIDLSVAAYDQLGAQSAGVLPVTWQFIS